MADRVDQSGEESSERQRTQLRLLAESFPGPVAGLDEYTRHTCSNDAYNRWFGFSANAVDGKRLQDVLERTSYTRIRPHVTAALAGRGVTFHTLLRHSRLGRRRVRITYLPHTDTRGRVNGFLWLTRDLAESNSTQEAWQAEHFHAQRTAAVGEMVTALAHDLNQPLGAITSYVGGLIHMLDRGAGSEQLIPILRKISEQASSAADIVHGLRDFLNRGATRNTPISVSALLHKALSLTEGRLHQAGASVDLRISPQPHPLLGDPVQLEQVLVNLILNGLDAMENTMPAARRLTLSSASHDADHVDIAVQDTGEGIPAERLPRIFEAFHTTRPEGMGIGLAISRAIVESHGGQLWVESCPGHGACFFLRLPTAKPDEAAEPVACVSSCR